MKHKKLKLLFLILSILFISCNDKIYLTHNYYLLIFEGNDYFELNYKLDDGNFIGVLNKKIDRYSYTSDYIYCFNKKDSEYYIIPIKEKISYFPDDNKIGPLSKVKFDQFLLNHRLETPIFKVVYENDD